MTMTLEEKVAKKAKSLDKLKYNKGIAIILLDINEEASEYDCDVEYKVRFHFKSKAAIKRIGDLLGEFRFNKKAVLSQFERGINYKDAVITSYENHMLDGGSNILKEVNYNYVNNYSDRRFYVHIDPRKPLTDAQNEYFTGSTADGEPLSDYFNYLQKSIIEGNTQYIL